MSKDRESIKVLQECAEIQLKKSKDYQNDMSRIRQADYYPRGVATIVDLIYAKTLRMQSVIEAMEKDPTYTPNFESIEDSAKDLINYASFVVAYCRGKMDGQSNTRDFLNRPIKLSSYKDAASSTAVDDQFNDDDSVAKEIYKDA